MVQPFQRLLNVFSTRLNFLAVARIFGDNWAFRSARARSIESILVEWRIFEGKEAILKNAAFSRLRHYVRLSSMVISRFLWFLAVSKPIREKIDVGSRICAQLVVINSKINIYRHVPRCRQVLNSKNLIEFPASFFITAATLVV